MTINLDIVGRETTEEPFCYNENSIILYALGIGAGINDLDFIYEKDLKVYPTFAVVPMLIGLFRTLIDATLDKHLTFHAEQQVIMHRPIPTKGTIHTKTLADSFYDKGDAGALFNGKTKNYDDKGNLLFETRSSFFDTSKTAGNFGGDRGPKVVKLVPPKGKEPDFQISYKTSKNQAALYRLNGDINPLHIDPEFAEIAGFNEPILHGLCTYGYAGRAVLQGLCENEPEKLKSFSVRFLNAVFPGDTLITKGWQIEDKVYVIQTECQDGRVVLGNGRAEIA